MENKTIKEEKRNKEIEKRETEKGTETGKRNKDKKGKTKGEN